MAEIHIVRAHRLGLATARRLARRWAEVARDKLGVQCVYQQGEAGDVVRFSRPGARGALKVGPDGFALVERIVGEQDRRLVLAGIAVWSGPETRGRDFNA